MKILYNSPLVEVSQIASQSIVCASGSNEDFGLKNGSYDLAAPNDPFSFKF